MTSVLEHNIGNMTGTDSESLVRPKRQRSDPQRYFFAETKSKFLELEGIVRVLREYDDYDGGINCSICGKLYRSKVCFTKHLWEHSVYWDQFDGERNQDRVLSIQAALILYSGYHGYADNNSLSFLLVTAPHSDKKRADGLSEEADEERFEKKHTSRRSPVKRRSPSSVAAASPEKKTCSPSVSETRSSDARC